MFFFVKKLVKDWAIKMILALIFTWICDHTAKPLLNFFYVRLEDEGYFFVDECKRMTWGQLITRCIEAKAVLKLHNDLPTTDHVFYYANRDDYTPYLQLMHHGADYLVKLDQSRLYFTNREEYIRRRTVIRINMKIYDGMDDLRRQYVDLYKKRIKLAELKELTNSEDYYKLKIPQIVPPDFVPIGD